MAQTSGNPVRRGPRSARKVERCTQCGAKLRQFGESCPNCGAPYPGTHELAPPTPAPTFKERWLPIILIAALAFVVYLPSLDNGFVSWDDDHYIYKNHQVHYDDGIESIWFDVFKHTDKKFQGDGRKEDRVSHQYYPMVFTIYWLEFRLYQWFGDADPYLTIEENIDKGQMNAFGFHLVSVLLHMVNVMLLIFCFRQLGVSNWVAWTATLLFALHPMHASTVAWAAERKNIISLMFYLLTLMSYIKMRRDGKWWRYVLAIVMFQAALFSKTVSLTLPVMLYFTDRILERRWDAKLLLVQFVTSVCLLAAWGFTWLITNAVYSWPKELGGDFWLWVIPTLVTIALALLLLGLGRNRDPEYRSALRSIVRILPFIALSQIAAWTTINVEDRQRTIPITPQQRWLLPPAVLLWYPMKLLLPFDQTPVYSLWPVDATQFIWYVPWLVMLALGVFIVMFRRRLGPPFLWALLFYCVTQGPMLGIKNINYFQFAYVADHYAYHGFVGLMLMLALGFNALRQRLPLRVAGVNIFTILVCALGLGWGARTFFYTEFWQTAETFWGRVLDKSPDCWPGWYNTANARKRDAMKLRTRIQRATLTDEERAELREQADALLAKMQSGDTPDKRRRTYTLQRDGLLERSAWPDLTPQEVAQLEQEKDALLDDAAERYMRVKEIHHQIVQPIDQWISVRRLQRNWTGALQAAELGAKRFPTYVVKESRKWTCYHSKVGEFAYYCKQYKKSAAAYRQAGGLLERKKGYDAAIDAYTSGGVSAQKGGNADDAIELFIRAGQVSTHCADGFSTQGNSCRAARYYDRASRCYASAYGLDKQQRELQRTAIELQKKYLTEQERCEK